MGWNIYLQSYKDKQGKSKAICRITSPEGNHFKNLPIKINPNEFDKKKVRVKATADNATAINALLTETTTLLNEGWSLYESGSYNWEELIAHINGAKTNLDLLSFINTVIKDDNTENVYKGVKDVYGAAKKVLGRELSFVDLNYNITNKLIMDWKGRVRSATVKTYKYHWGLIVNTAYQRKLTTYKFNPKSNNKWKTKRDKTTIKGNPYVETVKPEDFLNAIDRCTNLMHINGLASWLLSFCLRGMYFTDFCDIHTKSMDIIFEHPRWGGCAIIHHYRHKTNEPMWILLPNYVEELRNLMRGWLEVTHGYKINTKTNKPYLKTPTYILSRSYSEGWFFNGYNKDTWNTINKQLAKVGLESFKSARKTFETVSLTIETSAETRDRLLGHEVKGVKKSYQDWEWDELQEKVHNAHDEILTKFRIDDLLPALINKANELLDLKGYDVAEFYDTWNCWDSSTIEAVTSPYELVQG